LVNVDVSASTEAFLETVCLIAIRRSVSGRTGCRGCGRVGKTPRLCSSTCLAPSWCLRQPVPETERRLDNTVSRKALNSQSRNVRGCFFDWISFWI